MSDTNIFTTTNDLDELKGNLTLVEWMISKEGYKRFAVSSAKNIVVDFGDNSAPTPYEDFINLHRLKDPMYIPDLKAIISPSSANYYVSIDTAISDINVGNTNNSSSSANAVAEIIKNDSITVLRLLTDVTITKTYTLSKPFIFDLNGHTLTGHTSFTLRTANGVDMYIYGMKPGSKAVARASMLFGAYGKNMYILGGEYYYESTAESIYWQYMPSIFYRSPYSESGAYLPSERNYTYVGNAKINISYYPQTISKSLAICALGCNTTLRSDFDFENTDISIGSNIVGNFAIDLKTNGSVQINNCTMISYDSPYIDNPSKHDMATSAVICLARYLLVKNSLLKGPNAGLVVNGTVQDYMEDPTVFIDNSILSGAIHGGMYLGGHTQYRFSYFIKNSKCNKHSEFGNPYACYVSNDCDVKFDNCKFTSFDNLANYPAIKADAEFNHTQVYISNCEMDGIRVDARCRAYIGLGMPDALKQQSVGGEIIDTGNESYSFNLIEI